MRSKGSSTCGSFKGQVKKKNVWLTPALSNFLVTPLWPSHRAQRTSQRDVGPPCCSMRLRHSCRLDVTRRLVCPVGFLKGEVITVPRRLDCPEVRVMPSQCLGNSNRESIELD